VERTETIGLEADANPMGNAIRVAGERSPQPLRQRLTANRFLRQNVLLFLANMGTSAFSYLFHPIVGHLLGPAGYGTVLALSSLSVVLLIPTQVVANIAIKFSADLTAQHSLGQVSHLIRRATVYTLLLGVVATAIFVGLSPLLAGFLKLAPTYVVITSLGFIIAFAHPLNTGVIQGRQQFAWFAAFNFLVAAVRVGATAVVLLAGSGINGVLWASLVTSVVIYALTFVPLRDVLRVKPRPIPSIRPLVTYSLGATFVVSGSLLLTNTDTILTKHFFSATDAGYYIALVTIGRIVLFVGGSFAWVLFPKVAALHQEGQPYHAVLGWTFAGTCILSSAVVVLFWFFPDKLVTLIFHAPAAVSRELFWYGLAMLFLALSNVLITYFLSLARMAFVPFLLLCCALQAALILVWHGSIAQVVAAVTVVMAVLFCGLAALYVVDARRDRRRLLVKQALS